MNNVHKIIVLFISMMFPSVLWAATHEVEARQLFNRTYQMVFGPQGSSLHYSVNLVGLSKAEGTIWYKGKKIRYEEPRYASWSNGITKYLVDKKKKTVSIYNANDQKKGSYMSKFQFTQDDYTYHWKNGKKYDVILIKAKHAGIKGIREVKLFLNRVNHYPVSLKIKLAFFWTTVKITNFKSGGLTDDIFKFPSHIYRSYKYVDER